MENSINGVAIMGGQAIVLMIVMLIIETINYIKAVPKFIYIYICIVSSIVYYIIISVILNDWVGPLKFVFMLPVFSIIMIFLKEHDR